MANYLETLEASPHTRATYRHGLDHFAAYLTDAGLDPQTCGPERLDVTHLAGFYSRLRRRGPVTRTDANAAGVDADAVADPDAREAYSPRSLAVYTAAARSFLTKLAIAGLAAHLDLDRMRRRVPKTEYPHVDPSAVIPQVVAYCDQQLPATGAARLILLRNRALLHTLDATGMRAAGCLALRRSQLAAGQDGARIRGKGRKTRAVFFAGDACAAIAAYLAERHDDHPYLYMSHGRGPARAALEAETVRRPAPLTTAQVYHLVRTAALAVGAPEVHPHTLRHHRASRWLTDGMPLEMVQELLGHASIVVTRTVYAHYLGSAVRDAYFAHAVREARDRMAAP